MSQGALEEAAGQGSILGPWSLNKFPGKIVASRHRASCVACKMGVLERGSLTGACLKTVVCEGMRGSKGIV